MSGDPAQHPPRPRRVLSAAKARMSSSASASASSSSPAPASSSEISNLKSEISTRAEESGPSLRSGPGVGARQWTDAQWRGISTTGRSLLVSAAAGSGKTAVLAERCAYLVCDAQQPCDVDELLVVTFTDAAAAEMRTRIGQALRDRAAAAPSERLSRQLALLDRASISTLHGFCSRLLRQYFHAVGLDPAFAVLDADDARLLRNDVARQLFADRYELDPTNEFRDLVDAYADGNDERLVRLVIRAHEMQCSLVDPVAWSDRALARIRESAEGKDLAETELGQELHAFVSTGLASIAARCDAAIEQVPQLGDFRKYLDLLREHRSTLYFWEKTLREQGVDGLAAEVAALELGRMPPVRNDVPNKDAAKAAVDAVREAMKAGPWRDCLRFTTAQWRDGMRAVLPHARVFLELVKQFGNRYRMAKDAARSVDFSDLERYALAALRDPADPSGLSPSAAARECHRRFRHVLVDEYQDINEVQDAILTLLSGEGLKAEGRRQKAEESAPEFFSVGDVKQSIYRFRLAEPTRFLERERQFRSNPGPSSGVSPSAFSLQPSAFGSVIDLQTNFRSRGPLLSAINAVFERLMTAEAADIHYDHSHRLQPGRSFPDPPAGGGCFAGAPVELHLLPQKLELTGDDADEEPADPCDDDADLDRAEREAVLVAHRIRELLGLDGGKSVCVADATEPAGYRPIRFGDIVILLRSMKHKADQYAQVLEAAGIPVHSESSSGYFESMEVRDMLALLALLDNQRQDVPLAAVLRSPLAGLDRPEDAMATIRVAYPPGREGQAFHEAVRRYAAEKDDALARWLREFYAKLNRWRALAQRRPLADLVAAVYDDTGFLAYVGGLHNGRQRVANLLYLRERAAQFGTFHRQGLSRFLQFLDSLREESDLGQPSVASEAEDVVRIMSVHRSKGLEFPVVVLPDLGKKINLQDCAGNILFDRKAGLGMVVMDEAKRVRYPSLSSMLVQNRLRQQSLAEELRVLYVAMTRAQEHLVLVGTCGTEAHARWDARWGGHSGPLPADAVLGATTMLDWIGPVAAATGPEAFDVRSHDVADVLAWRHPSKQAGASNERLERLARLEPLDPPPAPSAVADEVAGRLTARYPFESMTKVAAAVPMTHAGGRKGATTLPKSPLLAGVAPPGADEVGTATHRVVQHLDFRRADTREAIAAQVNELVEWRLLSPAEAARGGLGAPVGVVASGGRRPLRGPASGLRRGL